jgi:SPP1 family predicted phage head-tail adaptor
MRAGQLRHRITIEQPTQAKNSIGEVVLTWSTFSTVWAAIEPAAGSTYYAANQLDARVDGRVRIRYRSDLLPTMRIKFGDRIFIIVSIIQPQENHRELHLMYTEALD